MHGIKWHSAKEISEYILGIEHGQGTRALPAQPGRLGATAQPMSTSRLSLTLRRYLRSRVGRALLRDRKD